MLLPSKTKDNVDHAGLSLLQDQSNQFILFKKRLFQAYLNNNWLIVHPASEIKDAMED